MGPRSLEEILVSKRIRLELFDICASPRKTLLFPSFFHCGSLGQMLAAIFMLVVLDTSKGLYCEHVYIDSRSFALIYRKSQ